MRRPPHRPIALRALGSAALIAFATLFPTAAAVPAQGKVFSTVDQAIERAFPACDVERTTAYLDKHDQARVTELCGGKLRRAMVYAYAARKGGRLVGTAYLDSHRVRTLRETLLVVVTPHGRVREIEVLAFGEPTEYLPRDKWYAQFEQKGLDRELHLKRGIDGVSGATLTARATTDCARRVLAVHQVLAEKAAAKQALATKAAAGAEPPRRSVSKEDASKTTAAPRQAGTPEQRRSHGTATTTRSAR